MTPGAGMTNVYLIVLHEPPDEGVRERLDSWEKLYWLTDTAVFVHDAERTTDGIAEHVVGDEEEDGAPLLVVLDVSDAPYAGRSYTGLWEWLRKVGRS